jgi:hypothetical protein
MARSILFVTCTVLFVLQASYGAAAKSTLITECGAKSAAIIEKSTPACITALKSLKVCTQACANIKAAILDGENPTKCQKATVFSSKFVADASAKKKYIQVHTVHYQAYFKQILLPLLRYPSYNLFLHTFSPPPLDHYLYSLLTFCSSAPLNGALKTSGLPLLALH